VESSRVASYRALPLSLATIRLRRAIRELSVACAKVESLKARISMVESFRKRYCS
jgi:hypothetical protein